LARNGPFCSNGWICLTFFPLWSKIRYYRDNWAANEKEQRVITAYMYVKRHPNLRLHSSARNEAQHPVIMRFLNSKMDLEAAVCALMRNLEDQA
jgi:hypothetical protein